MPNLLDQIHYLIDTESPRLQVSPRRRIHVKTNNAVAIPAGQTGGLGIGISFTDRLISTGAFYFEQVTGELTFAEDTGAATVTTTNAAIFDVGFQLVIPIGEYIASTNSLTGSANISVGGGRVQFDLQPFNRLLTYQDLLAWQALNNIIYVQPLQLAVFTIFNVTAAITPNVELWCIYRLCSGVDDG
jgi:hypothetical protein